MWVLDNLSAAAVEARLGESGIVPPVWFHERLDREVTTGSPERLLVSRLQVGAELTIQGFNARAPTPSPGSAL